MSDEAVYADPSPAYFKVQRHLVSQIDRGVFKPGDPVPTEAEICKRYGVSRTTARRALAELMRDGRVFRPTPRGRLHVVRGPVDQQLLRFVGFFTEDLLARGLRHEAQVLSAEWVPAAAAPSVLRLGAPERVALITRLHRGGDVPMALQRSYLPGDLFPDILAQNLSGSLLELVEARYGLRFVRASQHLRARLPARHEQLILQIPHSLPVFVVERTSFDERGRALEHLVSVLPSDRYNFRMELSRS